ncbi:MAG: hypothetical protein RJQ08_13570 [Salinisphaeraceae bacterium]
MTDTSMPEDEQGRAQCPSCTGIKFYLRLPDQRVEPCAECMTCGAWLIFAPPPLEQRH